MNTMTASTLSTVTPPPAPAILDELTKQAKAIVGAVFKQPLVSFQPGARGNFPYYWTDPDTLAFNTLTYQWINNSMISDVPPIQQMPGSLFTNSVQNVLAKVTYQLSTADQAKLNQAYANAKDQQMTLLTLWRQTYGTLPPLGKSLTEIDAVMAIVTSTWATPPTTLTAMQVSRNLNNLLNTAPASGKGLLPVVANYVNALGDSVTLANAQVMSNGYVSQALSALQSPAADNGGMQLNDGTNLYYPSYAVTTPIADIINGLKATGNAVTLNMDVSLASDSEYSVSVNGGAAFSIPIGDFFGIDVSGSASYFHDKIVSGAASVSIQMSFTGVTVVNFSPVAFNESSGLNWYLVQPILDAIANKGQDVSGFQFSPDPDTDFSANGSFGILQGVAISNYPSVTITVQTASYDSIQTTFEQQVSTSLSFLGIPLGGGSESTYSHSASSNAATSTVKISFTPPQTLVAGTSTTSQGWVLGVATYYPTVTSSSD
jgi:hypothetical protein